MCVFCESGVVGPTVVLSCACAPTASVTAARRKDDACMIGVLATQGRRRAWSYGNRERIRGDSRGPVVAVVPLEERAHEPFCIGRTRCVEEWRPSECGNDGRAGALTGSDISVENMLCGSLQGAVYSRCLTEAITGPKDARLARVSVQDEKTNALGTGDCRGRSGADARSRDRPFRVSRLDIRFHTSIDVPSFTCRARDRCAPVYLLSAHHILTRAIGTAGRRLRCTARVTVSVVSAPSMQRAA
jgi:hypothetical protein